MKKIADIVSDIREELEGAEHYAKEASRHKEDDRALSDAYASMASQELGHVDALHSQAVRIIQDYRAKNGEPPEAMLMVWNWEHDAMVSHTAKVKALLEMAKK